MCRKPHYFLKNTLLKQSRSYLRLVRKCVRCWLMNFYEWWCSCLYLHYKDAIYIYKENIALLFIFYFPLLFPNQVWWYFRFGYCRVVWPCYQCVATWGDNGNEEELFRCGGPAWAAVCSRRIRWCFLSQQVYYLDKQMWKLIIEKVIKSIKCSSKMYVKLYIIE